VEQIATPAKDASDWCGQINATQNGVEMIARATAAKNTGAKMTRSMESKSSVG
jgi:hypothetical protein